MTTDDIQAIDFIADYNIAHADLLPLGLMMVQAW